MAVRFRVVRMSHARQGTAGGANHRENKWPPQIRPEVVTRNLITVALEGDFLIGQRNRLDTRNGLGLRKLLSAERKGMTKGEGPKYSCFQNHFFRLNHHTVMAVETTMMPIANS